MKIKKSVLAIGITAIILTAIIGRTMLAKEPEPLVINTKTEKIVTIYQNDEIILQCIGEVEWGGKEIKVKMLEE